MTDALVVGAGIGGLTTALALRRRGIAVRVLEQADRITEVGAGIQLGPNAMAVLSRLGLGEALIARAMRPGAVSLCDGPSGRELARYPLGPACLARFGQPFLNLHRADLIDTLATAARAAGAGITTGCRIEKVRAGAPPMLTDATGAEHAADWAIMADGVHSRGRAILHPEAGGRFLGHVAWRAIVSVPTEGMGDVRVWMAPGRHLVAYPIRPGAVNLVAVEATDTSVPAGWRQAGDPADLRAAFAGLCPEAGALLAAVETVRRWGLFDPPPLPTWHRGRLIVVGDAAHPMLPYLAQGAGMAIEDAWAVAQAVADGDLSRLATRQARTARVSRAAAANGRLYHAKGPARLIRNLGMSALHRAWPAVIAGRYDWLYGHDETRADAVRGG